MRRGGVLWVVLVSLGLLLAMGWVLVLGLQESPPPPAQWGQRPFVRIRQTTALTDSLSPEEYQWIADQERQRVGRQRHDLDVWFKRVATDWDMWTTR